LHHVWQHTIFFSLMTLMPFACHLLTYWIVKEKIILNRDKCGRHARFFSTQTQPGSIKLVKSSLTLLPARRGLWELTLYSHYEYKGPRFLTRLNRRTSYLRHT